MVVGVFSSLVNVSTSIVDQFTNALAMALLSVELTVQGVVPVDFSPILEYAVIAVSCCSLILVSRALVGAAKASDTALATHTLPHHPGNGMIG